MPRVRCCLAMTDSQDDHGLFAILKVYWRAYGGWLAVVCSPFFLLSLGLLLLTASFWTTGAWWDQVISVMPNLLGFTLGGFAVFLGFGDEKFKRLIAGEDESAPGAPSPYMEVCAAFLHFVLVQVVALLVAIVSNASILGALAVLFLPSELVEPCRWLWNLLGYWLYLYGLCLAAAAAVAIFRVAFWFDSFQSSSRGDD